MPILIILLISITLVSSIYGDTVKTTKFRLDKLVRDKIPAHHDKNGSVTHLKSLNDKEFDAVLRTKLQEETEEVCSAKTKEELTEELADLFEVVDTLISLHGITLDEIHQAQAKKREERGGFHGRSFVTVTEHPVGSQGEKYCRANPEKYKEVKEPVFKSIVYGSDDYRIAVALREEILRKPMGLTFTPEELAKENNYIHLACFLDNEMVATAGLVPEGDSCRMQQVAVKANLQGKGVGSKLMQFCENSAREHGFKEIYCAARGTAIPFYLKNGYIAEGEPFEKVGISHQIMRKRLY